jgi:hypothetical protein
LGSFSQILLATIPSLQALNFSLLVQQDMWAALTIADRGHVLRVWEWQGRGGCRALAGPADIQRTCLGLQPSTRE